MPTRLDSAYPRDLIGYAATPPAAAWPGGARLALQFVLNYEEGGESSILHGDHGSEKFLSEIISAESYAGVRHMSMESIYDYGSRVGVWRILELFRREEIPITLFAVAMALERNPAVVEAALHAGHELCSHGYRWIDYQFVPESVEREHLQRAVEILRRLSGERPRGWYTGRNSPNTRRLVVEAGGFLYDADAYDDDLPYWTLVAGRAHLVVPYTLDVNDMRFATPQGFNSGEQFYTYLRDTFDVLYAESAHTPRMMSVGLHCRLVGRPGRLRALERFIAHARAHSGVWFCRRVEIARHWHRQHPFHSESRSSLPHRLASSPRTMSHADFLQRYGGVYEHSPWVAEQVHAAGFSALHDTAEGLHAAMVARVDAAPQSKQLELLHAHPDLAGRLAVAGDLTQASRSEQASAGLERCTPEEYARFQQLNTDYRTKFGFPFIMAVKGRSREQILDRFILRLEHRAEEEFDAALAQTHRIALLRLREL